MFELLGQMVRIPVALMNWSAQLMMQTVRGLQPSLAASMPPGGAPWQPPPGGASMQRSVLEPPAAPPPPAAPTSGAPANFRPEETMMSDQDLSGNDLKYVRFSILFTKRNLEASLQQDRENLLDYSTDGASFAALKIGEFMGRVAAGKVPRPEIWKENDYPTADSPELGWVLPSEDLRYITLIYEVERRLPLQDAYYARDQVKALQGIKSELSEISRKMGP